MFTAVAGGACIVIAIVIAVVSILPTTGADSEPEGVLTYSWRDDGAVLSADERPSIAPQPAREDRR